MRILYLAHRVPYPPNKGEKLRAYHHLRHLAQRHDVHLIAFVDQPEDLPGADALRAFCRSVRLVPLDRRLALLRGAWSLLRGRSLSEGFFESGAMHAAVVDAVRTVPIDVAWAYSSTMAPYLAPTGAAVTIADFVDVDSEKWRQYGAQSRGPLRWAYRLEAARLRACEARCGRAVTHVLFVSAAEAALFRSFCPDARAVRVIPNGVDTTYFVPPLAGHMAPEPVFLFTGALDYRPNVEAVLFTAREVLPLVRQRVPAARFVAVGHRPVADLQRVAEASHGTFEVAGSVPDVRPYFRAARAYIAPLELGRGVQNKVLEAMAMRVPVVASPLAIAGLAAEPGRHVVECRTAAEYADAVADLLEDPSRGGVLANAALDLVLTRYSWEQHLALLDEVLDSG